MSVIQGRCDERFKEIKDLLKQHIEIGEETGASICINIDGENVVDMWGGYIDQERQKIWQEDTIVNLYSTTKEVTALAALMLIDRGQLNPDEQVSHYWPEFSAKNVKVRHVLSHTAGLCGWAEPMTLEDIFDLEKANSLLAKQTPFWEPGTASGYHSMTMGHLVSELVRRVTGDSLKHCIAHEIAAPLGADLQLGAKESDWERISPLIAPKIPVEMPTLEKGSAAWSALTNPKFGPTMANNNAWRNAELGASNGHGNARSIARVLSIIALDGKPSGIEKPLLSTKTINSIFEVQAEGIDLVLGAPCKYGVGFGLVGKGTFMNWMPEGRICFWSGWGGSFGVIDVDRCLTIGYAMNQMETLGIAAGKASLYLKSVYEALGVSLPESETKL